MYVIFGINTTKLSRITILNYFTPKRVATESEDQGELEETNDEGGEITII